MKILFFLLLFFVDGFSCVACMCYSGAEYSNNECNLEWWNSNDYIFKARIDSVITKTEWRQELFFTVLQKFKGDISEHMRFDSPKFASSCQWDLEDKIGEKFMMYGYIDENGVLVSHPCQGTIQLLTENEIDSLQEWQYIRNVMKQELKFIEDLDLFQNGLVKTYYSNGNITAKGHFENYKPIGYWKYYTFDGKISSHGRYKNYKKDGVWVENIYKIKARGNDIDRSHYTLALQGFKKGKYLDGEKVGIWKTFDVEGE